MSAPSSPRPAPREGAPEGPVGSGGDPVRGLLRRHRGLCEGAVDPLEIAVGLETHGLTDRGAARFRHRDVFSLAEELYARAPRTEAPVPAEPRPGAGTAARLRTAVRWLLPGLLCALTAVVLALVGPEARGLRVAVGAAGALAVALAVGRCLRGSGLPLRAAVAGCWLVGYALYGDGLLAAVVAGGPEQPPEAAGWAVPLTLALGFAWAYGCARWFAGRAGVRLAASRSPAEFSASVRPLLALSLVLFAAGPAAVWAAVHRLVGAGGAAVGGAAVPAAVAALGLLLHLALLATAHGFGRSAAAALAGAAVAEVLVLASVFAGRLPWLGPLAAPTELLTAAHGTAALPAVVCAAAALALLCRTAGPLTRACAHRRIWPPHGP